MPTPSWQSLDDPAWLVRERTNRVCSVPGGSYRKRRIIAGKGPVTCSLWPTYLQVITQRRQPPPPDSEEVWLPSSRGVGMIIRRPCLFVLTDMARLQAAIFISPLTWSRSGSRCQRTRQLRSQFDQNTSDRVCLPARGK